MVVGRGRRTGGGKCIRKRRRNAREKRREESRLTTRVEEKEESDGGIVRGVENEVDQEIQRGELGDEISRIVGQEEITALWSLREVGKRSFHDGEEITTREL